MLILESFKQFIKGTKESGNGYQYKVYTIEYFTYLAWNANWNEP